MRELISDCYLSRFFHCVLRQRTDGCAAHQFLGELIGVLACERKLTKTDRNALVYHLSAHYRRKGNQIPGNCLLADVGADCVEGDVGINEGLDGHTVRRD